MQYWFDLYCVLEYVNQIIYHVLWTVTEGAITVEVIGINSEEFLNHGCVCDCSGHANLFPVTFRFYHKMTFVNQ